VPGELRSRVVWIGGRDIAYSTYNPTPPDDIAACLEETMRYLRCEGMQAMQQGLIVRMAVAHAHFEALHPFRDGNGRVGRLLLPLMMAAEGHAPLYLSSYIEAHKAAYYASLKAAQQRLEWHEAVGFVADAIVGTVNELLATRAALSTLRDLWRARRKFRRESAALRAIDVLPHYPVLTIRRLADILDVSIPSATQAIGQLVEAGILGERTGYVRNRVFAATEALSIINRPFGETPILPAR
jgi:Fic family protein